MRSVQGAQLYWDDGDPSNEGWWLRYEHRGSETGCELDGSRDRDLMELAQEAFDLIGIEIRVYRPGREDTCLRYAGEGDWRWF